MNPWFAKAAVLLATAVMIGIRAPHGQRSRKLKVIKNGKDTRELILLTIAWLGFFVPLLWVATPLFSFADYPLMPGPWAVGCLTLWLGLWLFYRSHADLGANWSITLEVREQHQLVTAGVYRQVRHPMYSALLVYSLGQALVLPNWVAGPSYLVAMAVLFALRVGQEERMMLEHFGDDYAAYASRTKRIIPGVW